MFRWLINHLFCLSLIVFPSLVLLWIFHQARRLHHPWQKRYSFRDELGYKYLKALNTFDLQYTCPIPDFLINPGFYLNSAVGMAKPALHQHKLQRRSTGDLAARGQGERSIFSLWCLRHRSNLTAIAP